MHYLFTYSTSGVPFYLGLRAAPSWERLQRRIKNAQLLCPKNERLQHHLAAHPVYTIEKIDEFEIKWCATDARREYLEVAEAAGNFMCNMDHERLGPQKRYVKKRRKSQAIPGNNKWYTYVYVDFDENPVYVGVGRGLRLLKGKRKKKGPKATPDLKALWESEEGFFPEIRPRDPVGSKAEALVNAARLREEFATQGIILRTL